MAPVEPPRFFDMTTSGSSGKGSLVWITPSLCMTTEPPETDEVPAAALARGLTLPAAAFRAPLFGPLDTRCPTSLSRLEDIVRHPLAEITTRKRPVPRSTESATILFLWERAEYKTLTIGFCPVAASSGLRRGLREAFRAPERRRLIPELKETRHSRSAKEEVSEKTLGAGDRIEVIEEACSAMWAGCSAKTGERGTVLRVFADPKAPLAHVHFDSEKGPRWMFCSRLRRASEA